MSSESPPSASSSSSSAASQISIVIPTGYGSSTCGYCSPPGKRSATYSSHTVNLLPIALTCTDYQAMVDRGWRRSGKHCYKPDLRRSCCPQYTIRLDTLTIHPTRSQRKVVNRWNRFVLEGDRADEMNEEPKGKKPSKKMPPFSLLSSVHESEASVCTKTGTEHPAHKFEVTLEPSVYTDEKYKLSCDYQAHVHSDEFTKARFTRFLVTSCLEPAPIPLSSTSTTSWPSHLPRTYGSYHQLYRLDGKLIALSVLDILPRCVSSVYFMYDPEWGRFSFGKLSAMREAALVREMYEHGASEMKYLYMGFYVHSCQKMKYKGEYSPSFLLDPVDYTWHPLESCIKLLEEYRYACFSRPESSLKDNERPGILPLQPVHVNDVAAIPVHSFKYGAQSLLRSRCWKDANLATAILRVIEGLGWELAKRMVLSVDVEGEEEEDEEDEEDVDEDEETSDAWA